jgi:hypothetical protein
MVQSMVRVGKKLIIKIESQVFWKLFFSYFFDTFKMRTWNIFPIWEFRN